MRKSLAIVLSCLAVVPLVFLQACGTIAPEMTEVWEEREVDSDIAFRIKRSIVCELIRSIRNVNRIAKEKNHNDFDVIPMDYGVQLQTTLTVEENTALNPSITYNRTLANAASNGVSVGQMFNFGAGAVLSSTATRVDTSYSYYVVGKIAGPGKNTDFCDNPNYPIIRRGSSLLLQSDLGIERYLINNVKAAAAIPSSVPASDKKDAKLDIYSYDIRFMVVSNGNINPVWKLVGISANTGGLPLLSTGRSRTHELILTFAPNSAKGFDIALQAHFNNQLVRRRFNESLVVE